MAKKKTRRKLKKEFRYTVELYGIIFIICAILGFGKYGPVGRFIASFALFLVGTLYMVLLFVFFIIGAYLLIKRKWPDFFTTRLLGIYLFSLGILIVMHQDFVIENNGNMMMVFQETINQLTTGFSSIMNNGILEDWLSMGGGLVGGAFAILFNALFSFTGKQIISWTLVITGVTLFTGFSLIDIIKDSMERRRENKLLKKEEKQEKKQKKSVIINDGNDEASGEVKADDNKIVISNINEITKVEEKTEKIETEKEVASTPVNTKPYVLPSLNLLDKPKKKSTKTDEAVIEKNITVIEQVLKDFNIIGKVVEVHIGPAVTQYELEIKSGTKLTKIVSLNKELALSLAKKSVRIEAPIPGKNTVGIELPNESISMVSFREVLEKIPESKKDSKLLVPLGKNIMGNVIWCEIDKTPHLLVAGSTGSGKSVCINGIISSILMRAKPDEVKLVMVDPKKVELSVYNGIPHLLCPVVTDPKKASIALNKMVAEMERRYDLFEESKTKNITTYNAYIDKKNAKLPAEEKMKRMPYIVVIVDELADLMMVASKDVEAAIMRITQMARAAGIHLIIATQRPSTDVITGVVKANIPSRIAFTVASNIDSRTILDAVGAEKLLGRGDMLFAPVGEIVPQRVQGAYISDEEIGKLIDYTVEQQKAEFDESLMNLDKPDGEKSASQIEDSGQVEEYDDPLYNEIVEFVIDTQKASASLLQRRFKLGYNRAARIIDLLEERGIIGPSNGSKPREVLVTLEKEDEE